MADERMCCLDCGRAAVMVDTDNDEAYCGECARTYRVYEGHYRMLEESNAE